jgi:hypothetical protein
MDLRSEPRFLDLERQIWKQIEEEVRAAGGFAQF